MRKLIALMLFCSLCSMMPDSLSRNKEDDWTRHKAKKWFRKKEWLGGLQLRPHESINIVEFARQYHANRSYWDKAFAFLKDHDLNALAKGKYPIDGDNVFATVTENPTKDLDSTQWESHRKYVDLQYVISGEERMGVCPVSKAEVTRPYSADKDVANYRAEGKIYRALPGSFFIFFPTEAHRPNITPGGKEVDKKIVIKVKADQ